jgi:hypothetical protein
VATDSEIQERLQAEVDRLRHELERMDRYNAQAKESALLMQRRIYELAKENDRLRQKVEELDVEGDYPGGVVPPSPRSEALERARSKQQAAHNWMSRRECANLFMAVSKMNMKVCLSAEQARTLSDEFEALYAIVDASWWHAGCKCPACEALREYEEDA